MAKKIRFPLEMDNGVEVRSMEELRNNFSLGRVLEYIQNEKLVTWLRDRYENNIANAIAELDKTDSELPKKVSAIFDVPYDEKSEDDLKQAAERAERVKRLKEFTDEKQFTDEIDKVAFDQDELYDLLDEEVNEIYLCGDRFAIPLSVTGVAYKGINNPVVVIDSKTEVDWLAKEITLEAVRFDEKYQEVVEVTRVTKEKQEKIEDSDSNNKVQIEDWKVKLLESNSLICWKGKYATNKEIVDNCATYVKQDFEIYYLRHDGGFGKYNLETGENTVFDVNVFFWSEDRHPFAVLGDMVYFKSRPSDYGDFTTEKRLFRLNTKTGEVSVEHIYSETIENIVNHNGTIYVIYGLHDKWMFYYNELEGWKSILKEISAYCFERDKVYYVREDLRGGDLGAWHVFYKQNLMTGETWKIAEKKFDTSGVNDDGSGFMESIEVKDNQLFYCEGNRPYGRTKSLTIPE